MFLYFLITIFMSVSVYSYACYVIATGNSRKFVIQIDIQISFVLPTVFDAFN